ncbi:DUF4476 domain-containing protein [Hymenobacter cheonanensis]|uniref:DUF4476 domain-containing protein n=1 Tax=Hymenobacter sp. CA2-7 TaxID=3063993 RepID=UPI00271413BE|nr:DUF4476 domain-containing protein [Hymenobacter sp. CA2-7]MDO7884657.1 DUF4476 domain-containing protein [Hymenobacter sp. CA2-7]
MKTLFNLAATALLAWLGAAPALAAPPANLSITAERGQPFSLVLDGRLLTRPLAPQVRVGMLAPGRHWADFSVPTGYGPPLRFRTQVWLQPGVETDYVLLLSPYGPQLRQIGMVPLAGPGYGQGGYYGPGNGPYGSGQGGYYSSPLPPQGSYGNGQYDPSYDSRGGYPGQGQPQAYPAPTYPSQQQPQTYPAPTYPSQEQPQAYPAPAPPPTYPGGNSAPGNAYPDTTTEGSYDPAPNNASNLQPFTPDEIAGLAQDLRQRPTEAERLRTATQALDQSSLRANELAELMQTFTHDESRIELARFSYSHLSDPQDFSRVYDALQFKSSIRTLRQAVGLPPE